MPERGSNEILDFGSSRKETLVNRTAKANRRLGEILVEGDAGITTLVSFLQTSPVFAGLPSIELIQIANSSHSESFAKRARIFNQGEQIRNVFLVCSGTVKLTYSNTTGTEIIRALRCACELVDMPTRFGPQNHNVTAEAMTACQVLLWRAGSFYSSVEQNMGLSGNISRILGGQLVDLEQRYCELASERVERRVASTLIRLASQIGTRSEHGFVVPISRQDLAQLSGTNVFSISRLISRWIDLRLLRPSRSAVLIPSLEALDIAISEMSEEADEVQ